MVEPGESWGGKRSLAMARIAEGAAVGLRVVLGKDCVAAGASVMHGILVKIAHNAVSASTLLLRKSHRGLGPHW